MKFHAYLEQLFSGRVSISLVRALLTYRGKIFTIRGLARVAKVSPAEAAVVAEKLEERGIIRIQPVGRSYQILLNEKSYVLNKIVKQTILAEEKTLDALISVLKKNLNNKKIISVCLFGSVAMKTEKEDSDVDLLVISNDFEMASVVLARTRDEISQIFGNRLSPIVFTETELREKKNGNLVKSILNSYIIIHGKDIRELVQSR